MSICLLCGQNKKLCDAHIYPIWCYKKIIPNGSKQGFYLMFTNDEKPKRRPKGAYDKNLFCKECDQMILGKLDSYAKNIFCDNSSFYVKSTTNGAAFEFRNIDNETLKIFFLSVLWRAALSKQIDFNYITLPEKYLNKLKLIILGKEKLKVDDFATIITRFKSNQYSQYAKSLIGWAHKTRLKDGANYWVFNYPGGYKIFIKVDQRKIADDVLPVCLGYNGKAYILEYEGLEESFELRAYKKVLPVIKNIINK